MLRLQKYIAQSGLCSRRKAEELILEGMVKVNGRLTNKLGTKIDPLKDQVWVNGKTLKPAGDKIYIILNKPRGYETTCQATKARRKTVLDLVKIRERVFPVGRLDIDATGLLILTNDGEFANQIMHPRYEHEKEYLVDIEKPLNPAALKRLKQGVRILGKLTAPAKIKNLSPHRILIVIHEGMNHQVKRMLEAVGNRVLSLKRTRIGNIQLGSLPRGKWRRITPQAWV